MSLGRLVQQARAKGERIPSIADDVFTEMYSAFSRALRERRWGFDCSSVVMARSYANRRAIETAVHGH